jgi:thiamine-phosphate pyrophosphorylase
VLIYYITDRTQFAGNAAEQRIQLLETVRRAAAAEVDFIQLREKDLSTRELESLAREVLSAIRTAGPSRLLINHRTDVALAVGADGVHLTGADIAPSDVRALATLCRPSEPFLIAASCHSAAQVRLAEASGADFAVLAPIFEKLNVSAHGIGLEELRRAAHPESAPRANAADVRRSFPVFALGGVDAARASLCAAAGAAGVAGIRLVQQSPDLPALVRSIRAL